MKNQIGDTVELHLTDEFISKCTVCRLRDYLKGKEIQLKECDLARLESDPRAGIRSLGGRIRRKASAAAREASRLKALCRYEKTLWDQGVTKVAGIDEAGAGPLAGPVVAASVVFPPGLTIPGVDDSKKLSPSRREILAREIKNHALLWAVAQASPREIDKINIYQASLLAMRRAVERLDAAPEHLLIDARELRDVPIPQTSLNQGDARSFSIAAASILAKTSRDKLMLELDKKYPGYGFARHKGYPTREHRQALQQLGPTPEHRVSFTFKSP